jgi:hypothetical protein
MIIAMFAGMITRDADYRGPAVPSSLAHSMRVLL